MRLIIVIPLALLVLSACNSIRYVPDSMTPGAIVYATRGGYSMRRSIKEALEEHGYQVLVGRAKKFRDLGSGAYDDDVVPKGAKYAVRVMEREETIRAWWCMFNGFWWWDFNVSIGDQDTGEELLTWRGRGCANSSMRKLDYILTDMEKKDDNPNQGYHIERHRSMPDGTIVDF